MLNKRLNCVIERSVCIAQELSHEYITIEHLFLSLLEDNAVIFIMINCGVNILLLQKRLNNFLKYDLISLIRSKNLSPKFTIGLEKIIKKSAIYSNNYAENSEIFIISMLIETLSENDTYISFFLNEQNVQNADIIDYAIKVRNDTIIDVEHGSEIEKQPKCQKNFIESNILFDAIGHKQKEDIRDMQSDLPIFFQQEIPNEIRYEDYIVEKKDSEFLQKYSVDLNAKVLEKGYTPVIGREREVNRILRIMCCKQKNNAILVGEPGVGKTAIVEGVAHMIATKKAPVALQKFTIYMLDMSAVLAGTKYRGDFEERMRLIIKDLSSNKNAVVFIDEIQSIIGAGATNGSSLDASNILKPSLSRGDIRCIGTTTYKEYSQILSKDKAFLRRFHKINIEEPSAHEAVTMIEGIKKTYEDFYGIKYSKKIIEGIVELSDRFVGNNNMPDKAIGILDEVGARYVSKMKENDSKNKKKKSPAISLYDVASILSDISNVPKKDILGASSLKDFETVEKNLSKNIFGQEEAIKVFCNKLMVSKLKIHDEEKPIGSFLFFGPTGVGKTEFAKQVASHLHMNLIRVDMSEYSEQHSISKLIGAPPGYVGYENSSSFADSLYYTPYSVVLLDEIEKAHSSIYNSLLQVMDYGKITDSSGRPISFRNAIIIMTTNLGADQFDRDVIGFQNNNDDISIESVKNHFSPEFINRLSAIVKFKKLDRDIVREISVNMTNRLIENSKKKNINLVISPKVIDYIVDNNLGLTQGARLLDKFIVENLSSKIALSMVENCMYKNCMIKVDCLNGDNKGEGDIVVKCKKTNQKPPKQSKFDYKIEPDKHNLIKPKGDGVQNPCSIN